MSAFDITDGGGTSRKFLFAVGIGAAITLGGLLAAWWPGFTGSYPTMIGGLIAIYGAYAGANVIGKNLIGKNVVEANKATKGAPTKPHPQPEEHVGE